VSFLPLLGILASIFAVRTALRVAVRSSFFFSLFFSLLVFGAVSESEEVDMVKIEEAGSWVISRVV
jgi:hypothetical protein